MGLATLHMWLGATIRNDAIADERREGDLIRAVIVRSGGSSALKVAINRREVAMARKRWFQVKILGGIVVLIPMGRIRRQEVSHNKASLAFVHGMAISGWQCNKMQPYQSDHSSWPAMWCQG